MCCVCEDAEHHPDPLRQLLGHPRAVHVDHHSGIHTAELHQLRGLVPVRLRAVGGPHAVQLLVPPPGVLPPLIRVRGVDRGHWRRRRRRRRTRPRGPKPSDESGAGRPSADADRVAGQRHVDIELVRRLAAHGAVSRHGATPPSPRAGRWSDHRVGETNGRLRRDRADGEAEAAGRPRGRAETTERANGRDIRSSEVGSQVHDGVPVE